MTIRWRGVLQRHPRVLAGLFAAYWLSIFVLTHIPMPEVEDVPQNTDKFVHFVFYGGFVWFLSLWLSAWKPWNGKLRVAHLSAAAVYAALDEIMQIPIESRTADVWDFVMDLVGASLGLLLFSLVRRKLPWLWDGPKLGRSAGEGNKNPLLAQAVFASAR